MNECAASICCRASQRTIYLQQLRDEIAPLRLALAPPRAEVGAPRSAVHCTAMLDVHIAQQLDPLMIYISIYMTQGI